MDYSKLTVVEIKKLLVKKGLSTSGKKADLIKRLEEQDGKELKQGEERSIWAFQAVTDYDYFPDTLAVRFLPLNATILDATREMADVIIQDAASRGAAEYEYVFDDLERNKNKKPEKILQLLNSNNSRDLSHFVVKIYPVTRQSAVEQQQFGEYKFK